MGSPDPRAYARNKRGIAGSLVWINFVWINFDRHELLDVFRKAQGKFVADADEIRPQYQDSSVDGSAIFTSSIIRDIGPSVGWPSPALLNVFRLGPSLSRAPCPLSTSLPLSALSRCLSPVFTRPSAPLLPGHPTRQLPP